MLGVGFIGLRWGWIGGLKHRPSLPIQAKAYEILERNCGGCHGKNGPKYGGIKDITSETEMIETGRIVPGNAKESMLYKRLIETAKWLKRLFSLR